MRNSTTLAVCAVSTSLSVVLLFVGGIVSVLSYVVPMLLGFLMIMLRRTFGAKSAWITYLSVGILSFVLVSEKECMLMYAFFFGYYPIIRDALLKIKPRVLSYFVRLIIFNASMLLCQLALIYIFGIPFLEEGQGNWFIVVFAVLMNFLFVIYDLLTEKLNLLYSLKLEKRIKRIFK